MKKKPIKKNDKITLSSPEEIFKMISMFELRKGFLPEFIITTPDRREKIMEWFGYAPKDLNNLLGFSLSGIKIVTPRDVMLI